MSDVEAIFIGSREEPGGVARRIAEIVGGEVLVEGDGSVYVTGDLPHGAAGQVSANFYASVGEVAADERSVVDGYGTVWDVHVPGRDEAVLRAAGRVLFDRLVAAGPPWPLLLVHNHELLLAAAAPGAATTEFPAGTYPDEMHRDRWGRFDLVS